MPKSILLIIDNYNIEKNKCKDDTQQFILEKRANLNFFINFSFFCEIILPVFLSIVAFLFFFAFFFRCVGICVAFGSIFAFGFFGH